MTVTENNKNFSLITICESNKSALQYDSKYMNAISWTKKVNCEICNVLEKGDDVPIYCHKRCKNYN